MRLAALEATPGRQVAPELEPISTAAAAEPQLQIRPTAPQTVAVRAAFDLQLPGGTSLTVHRLAHVFVLPAAEVEVNAAGVEGDKRRFEVRMTRREGVDEVILEAVAAPRAPVAPAQVRLPLDQHTALFEVSRLDDGQLRDLEVVVRDTAGNELARVVGPKFFDEPALPETDLALARLGAVATTDSNYSGYTPAPLISGIIKVDHLHWAERAWASRDAREPHWLEIRLAEPAEVSQVWLYWSTEMGNMNASQNYTIIVLTDDGPVELAQVADGPTAVSFTRHELAPVRLVGVRVEQAEGGGPAHRPGIMWLREVCIVP